MRPVVATVHEDCIIMVLLKDSSFPKSALSFSIGVGDNKYERVQARDTSKNTSRKRLLLAQF